MFWDQGSENKGSDPMTPQMNEDSGAGIYELKPTAMPPMTVVTPCTIAHPRELELCAVAGAESKGPAP